MPIFTTPMERGSAAPGAIAWAVPPVPHKTAARITKRGPLDLPGIGA